MRVPAVIAVIAFGVTARAQAPATRLNPQVERVIREISEERIAATLKKLESFETRHVMSEQDHPTRGIGAAARWLAAELASYSPRLQVRREKFPIRKSPDGRIQRDVELENVVAVLPGVLNKDRCVVSSAHYDSLVLVRKKGTEQERIAEMVRRGMAEEEARRYAHLFPAREADIGVDWEASAAQRFAPGVNDDGSGTAAVLELARVMSRYEWDKSILFVAFAAEETGMEGSKAFAAAAKKQSMQIEAVLNNDIIGSEVAGNRRAASSTVRVFADGPEDSPSRALLRYVREHAERYVPSMNIDMIFRRDRFLRGGDHTSFANEGFAAVRFTSAAENYANQHKVSDTFANTSVACAARVARVNAAALASLALAPRPPEVNWTYHSGPDKGRRVPMLGRGTSGYDAALRWLPSPEPDVAGYSVLVRSTTSPVWEREVYVGNVDRYVMPDVSIDDRVIGVRAVDRDGNQSLVAAYLEPAQRRSAAEPIRPAVEPLSSAASGQTGTAADQTPK
ncbi:MAG TPA: M20/M25/M40 family metallo-hydrolase [Bryobacteraceae bacterium]|nr:M20/M25/M40 family metallo-hydrolase [Bryobacteraceae bacterium]